MTLKFWMKCCRIRFKEKVAQQNMEAAKRGYDYVKDNYGNSFGYKLEKTKQAGKKRIFLTGNEAIGLGALNAGCKFYAAYPMTPATTILHFLAPLDREYKMVVIQTESEIAAINMVAGASYAGVRSMTATSGGGFSLMAEAIGMVGMTETSPVIVLVQRPGPSTGLPTYSSQTGPKICNTCISRRISKSCTRTWRRKGVLLQHSRGLQFSRKVSDTRDYYF